MTEDIFFWADREDLADPDYYEKQIVDRRIAPEYLEITRWYTFRLCLKF